MERLAQSHAVARRHSKLHRIASDIDAIPRRVTFLIGVRLLEEIARHYVGGAGYQVVYGAVIIIFIVALPKGLVGGLAQLLRRRRKSVRKAAEAAS